MPGDPAQKSAVLTKQHEKQRNAAMLVAVIVLIAANILIVMAALNQRPVPMPADMEQRLGKYRSNDPTQIPRRSGPRLSELLPADPGQATGGEKPGADR